MTLRNRSSVTLKVFIEAGVSWKGVERNFKKKALVKTVESPLSLIKDTLSLNPADIAEADAAHEKALAIYNKRMLKVKM